MLKKSKLFFAGMILALSFIGCKATTDDAGDTPFYTATYEFHDTVTVLTGTDKNGTFGTDGDYVLFGDFPQDVVPEANVKTLGLETSKTKVTRGYMEFVVGSDGNYYVKCTEKAYLNYKYLDNSDVKQGSKTSRWFKVMPIKWRVVDTAYKDANGNVVGKLLVAENILTSNVPYFEDKENNRIIGTDTVYPNNYMHSQIRAYLNGLTYTGYDTTNSTNVDKTQWNEKGFLQAAFDQTARDAINDTVVDNGEESTINYDTANGSLANAKTYVCDPTTDKIFFLSEYEVTKYSKSTETYRSNGRENSRIRVTTDFAKANYAYQDNATDSGSWWLRSPFYSNSMYTVRCVGKGGDAGHEGGVNNAYRGIVPALSISF